MQIERLYLRNFRGFAEKDLEIKKRFTVISGENGSGKTAILKGLCVASGGMAVCF